MSTKKLLSYLPIKQMEFDEEIHYMTYRDELIIQIQTFQDQEFKQFQELFASYNLAKKDRSLFRALEIKQLLFAFQNSENQNIQGVLDKISNDHLEEDVEEINSLIKWFKLEQGWIVQQDEKNMKILYQQLPGSPLIVARIDTQVDIPLDVFASLIYETDLFPRWFPFIGASKTLLVPETATKILKMTIDAPFISDREFCVKAWGINNLDVDGSLYILSHSIDQNDSLLKRLNINFPLDPKVIRGDLTVFCTRITRLHGNLHQFSMVMAADMKLKYVPDYFPNFFLRKFSGLLFQRMISNSKNFKGSAWDKKRVESPEFYQWLDEIILRYAY